MKLFQICLFLSLALLWVMPGLPALANVVTPPGGAQPSYGDIFGSDSGDPYSSVFLHQMFGSLFPSALGVQYTNVFAELIGTFNFLVLIVGGVLFFYNVTVGVLQSAHEGEILGRRWSSLWAPLRIIFAVGLLVPVPSAGGYNLAQVGVSYLVKGSTNIASYMWREAATLVLSGTTPLAAGTGSMSPETVIQLYDNASCLAVLRYQMRSVNSNIQVGYYPMTQVVPNAVGGWSINRGNVTGNTTGIPNDMIRGIAQSHRRDGQVTAIFDGNNYRSIGVCGSWTTPEIPRFLTNAADDLARSGPNAAATATSILNAYKTRHYDMMVELNADIMSEVMSTTPSEENYPVLQGIFYGSDGNVPNITPQIEASILKGNLELSKIFADIRALAATEDGVFSAQKRLLNHIVGTCVAPAGAGGAAAPGAGQPAAGTIDAGNAAAVEKGQRCYGEGWLGAGSWYITMGRVNNELSSLMSARSTVQGPTITSGNARTVAYRNAGGETSRAWWGMGAEYASDLGNSVTSEVAIAEWDRLVGRYKLMLDNSVSGLTVLGFTVDPQIVTSIAQGGAANLEGENSLGGLGLISGANGLMDYLVNNWFSPGSWADDPMIGMMNLGHYLMDTSAAVMAVALVGSVFSDAAGNFGVAMATFFMVAGGTLSIILPFLPFFYWVLAATGYLLLVVEAIVAVSLWALAHMKLDGEGLSGQMGERGWMLLLSLLMTPVLMILGFIVGMTLYRVTSGLINGGIVYVARGIGNTTTMAAVVSSIIFPIMIIMMNITVLERSFSLVTDFPARVLKWIGGESSIMNGEDLNKARIATGAAVAGLNKTGSTIGKASTDATRGVSKKYGVSVQRLLPGNKAGGK